MNFVFSTLMGLAAMSGAEIYSSPDGLSAGKALSLFAEGRIAESRAAATEALEVSRRVYGELSSATADRYEDLGVLEWHLAEFQAAAAFLEKSLNLNAAMDLTAPSARLNLKLALLYETWGRDDECRHFAGIALRSFEASRPAAKSACKTCSSIPGEFENMIKARLLSYRLESSSGSSGAAAQLEKNLSDCRSIWPQGHVLTSRSYLDLALHHLGRDEIDKANEHLVSADAQLKKLGVSRNDLEWVPLLEAKALIQLKFSDKAGAESSLREATDLLTKALAPDSQGALQRMTTLSRILIRLNDFKSARSITERMSLIAEKNYGPGHPLADFFKKELQIMGHNKL